MSLKEFTQKKAIDEALGKEFDFGPFTWGETLGGFSSQNMALFAQGRPFILKRFDHAAAKQINRLEAIARFLREQNFNAPLPETTRTGALHFFCEEKTYALFLRNPGTIRHRAELSDVALKSTARNLAKLHLLKPINAKTLLGTTRRHLHRCSSSLASKDKLRAASNGVHLAKTHIETLTESLNFKRRLIEGSNYDRCAVPGPEIHFVHGDFQNENILFDANAEVTCFLDFEESFLGHGVYDVMNFVFLALCSDALSNSQLQTGRRFINHYRSFIPIESELVEKAIGRHFLSMASSTFLEERLVRGQVFFANLLRRDIAKMKKWKEEQLRIVKALV